MVVSFGKQVDTYINEFWSDFEFDKVSWNRERAPRPSVLEERAVCLKKLESWSNKKY